jgi:hypothetical protein
LEVARDERTTELEDEMRSAAAFVLVVVGAVLGVGAAGQTAPGSTGSDVYHVHFTKAAPGQAAALGDALMVPDKTSPMPDHFVVLRHQEGDDWDYVVIQHLGPKAEVTTAAAPNPARNLSAWHEDTFVSGPSWADFTAQMALNSTSPQNLIYIVGIQRAVPGHRDQLEKSLNAPAQTSKIQSGTLLLPHLEGGAWTFLTLTRYNSWQDLASDRGASVSTTATTLGSWADIRQHSAFHRDTIADRVLPRK